MASKTENFTMCADPASAGFVRKIMSEKKLGRSAALAYCVSYTERTMQENDRISIIRQDISALHNTIINALSEA